MAVPSLPAKERKRVIKSPNQSDSKLGRSTDKQAGFTKRANWAMILVILIFLFILLLLVSLFLMESTNPDSVPYNLHSELNADYSADNRAIIFPAVQLGLIVDVIRDLGTPNPQAQLATIQAGLSTSVATVTSYLPATATLPPPLDDPTPTSTAATLTMTLQPSSTTTINPVVTPTWMQQTPTPTNVKTIIPPATKPPSTKPPNTPSNPTQPPRTQAPPTPTITAPSETPIPPSPTIPPPTVTKLPPSPTNPPPTATKPPPTSTNPPPTSTPETTPYP